jgi:tRNA (cmo5U34)-methyltransferase
MWKMPLLAARERRHPAGRERIPEPMVMNDPDSVAQFHAGGATNPGQLMVYDFNARALNALLPEGARLLDLGVGSGRALAYLARVRPDIEITGVDLAPNMLATARELFDAERLNGQIELVEADITALPDSVTNRSWDGISCLWTLHQLPDFNLLRGAVRQISAVRQRSGAAVWALDFRRLRNPKTFPAFFDLVAPGIAPVLRKDGLASEAAGFTHDELATELAHAGLAGIESGHARPIPWLQAFWAVRADGKAGGVPGFKPARLPSPARADAAALRAGFTAKPF